MTVSPMATWDSARCPITHSLSVLGDRWSLLIIRDVLGGLHRFDELASHLGVSRAVLSTRLRSLVEAGLLDRVAYREAGSRGRDEYRLTPAGLDLVPVLAGLVEWGRRHTAAADLAVLHDDCHTEVHTRLVCENGHDVGVPHLRLGRRPRA